jgi:hypothetical protein
MSEGPPRIHGTSVHGVRAAAVRAFGEAGVRALRVSDAARRAIVDAIVLPGDWIPEALFIEVYEALFRERLESDEARLASFVGDAIGMGWGRVKRALVAMATPEILWRRAGSLWREEHTTGTLRATLAERQATITLEDHAYADSNVTRRVHAESMRYIISLSRVKNAKATHGLDGRRNLVVRVTWS